MNHLPPQQWSPPSWARNVVYLAGAALFIIQPLAYPPPNFWLLGMDSIVLIGLSPEVFRQFAQLVLAMMGKAPANTPKENSPPEPAEEGR